MGYTNYLAKYLKKAEAKKKDPLATKESMTVLHNVEARRQEHDALKREQGFPEEQDPNAMRYQRYAEVETDEQGKIMHNKPPWVVNEASEMIAEINDEDAPTYKKSDKAQNRAGKNTASLTKDWNPFKRKPKKDDPQDRQTSFWHPEQKKIAEDFVARQKELRSPEYLASKKRELEGTLNPKPQRDFSSKESIEAMNTAARKNIAEKNLPKAPKQKSVTKSLFNSEGQNYGGVIAPQRYEIVEKTGMQYNPSRTKVTSNKPVISESQQQRDDKRKGEQKRQDVARSKKWPYGKMEKGHEPGHETPEERAKRKSGTGIAPTSTQIPDDWKTPASVEQGKETRSKRYPIEEDMEKGALGDAARKIGGKIKDTFSSEDKPQKIRSTEFAARQAAKHGGLESDWENKWTPSSRAFPQATKTPIPTSGTGKPDLSSTESIEAHNAATRAKLRGGNVQQSKLVKSLIKLYKREETPEERAKRKSGTGLAPTSTLIEDVYPQSGSEGIEQGKQTHSKPRFRRDADEENLQKGDIHPDSHEDFETFKRHEGNTHPDTDFGEADNKNRFQSTVEYQAKYGGKKGHGNPAAQAALGYGPYLATDASGNYVDDNTYNRLMDQMGENRKDWFYKPGGSADPDGGEQLPMDLMEKGTPGAFGRSMSRRGRGSTPGAGDFKSKITNPEARARAKDPTMAIRREEPEYNPEGGAGQMTRSPGNVKGEGDKKKQEMITNYIRSLNKAGSLYPETAEEEEARAIENFLPALAAVGSAVGGAAKKAGQAALLGGDDGGDMQMTEKAGFGSGGHAREVTRHAKSKPTSGMKKKYGNMGALGFPQIDPKSKSNKGRK